MPIFHRRIPFAVIALAAAAACLDTTRPQVNVHTHTLMAVTDIVAGDSLQCVVFAQLPMPDSIQAPWTGTAAVQVRRYRNTAVGPVQYDTAATTATFHVTRGTGDSVYVAIQGAFSLVLSGYIYAAPYHATGVWTCDDRVPLSGVAPGRASGRWGLDPDGLVD